MFPPRKVTNEDVDNAKIVFDNARRNSEMSGNHFYPMVNIGGYFFNDGYVDKSREYMMNVISEKSKYDRYISNL